MLALVPRTEKGAGRACWRGKTKSYCYTKLKPDYSLIRFETFDTNSIFLKLKPVCAGEHCYGTCTMHACCCMTQGLSTYKKSSRNYRMSLIFFPCQHKTVLDQQINASASLLLLITTPSNINPHIISFSFHVFLLITQSTTSTLYNYSTCWMVLCDGAADHRRLEG